MLPDNVQLSSAPGNDLASFLAQRRYSQLGVLTDENTLEHCYPIIAESLPEHFVFTVRSGEEEKNLDTCTRIWKAMTDHSMDRHAAMLVLGGGVLGDMGGFCAATYKRGIDFILVPTTVLAQADASIGGKLGIDFEHLKNHIGVFQLPRLTLLYSGFLKTLPKMELRSGFAEVIKHALISDQERWDSIIKNPLDGQDWDALIKHSVDFKARVTTEDPTEKGLRKILNAGHTLGHAMESFLLEAGRKVMHGEAVAAGLIAEAWIGHQRRMIDDESFTQLYQYVLSIFGKIVLHENEVEHIAMLARQDKKNKGNKILCVLPDGIGHAKWDCEISLDEVKAGLNFYRLL